jgi:flagellar biosynthesis/type III secretory pathway protein FliH
LSNLLRSHSVISPDRPTSIPRIFGAQRVLRGEQIGVQRPISLSIPVSARAVLEAEIAQLDEQAPSAPPPDFAAIEEAARLQGYGVGYEQGIAEGRAAVEAEMFQAIQQLKQLASSVVENHVGFFRAAERQVVDLALQIAQKVVEKEVENMPDLAINVIRGALEEMDARTAVRVRVSPDDEELLRRRWAQCVPSGVAADRIELQADEKVQSGGAIIETTQGQVDAQLETKLAQLGNALWTFVMDVSISESDGEVNLGA